jgi:hypothetical protein
MKRYLFERDKSMSDRKDTELERMLARAVNKGLQGKTPKLTPFDRIGHDMELSELGVDCHTMCDCSERFFRTFSGKDKR